MNFNWADDTNCAVTVCDTEGVVIYQNKQSISVNGEYRGKSMLPCHNERSKGIIARILEKGDTNAYTIEKKGNPQNDLPNSLAPRGRHRRRYHRTVDADSRRNAALRTGIIEHPGPEASEPLNDTRNFNRKAAKNTRNNPYPIQEKSQTTAFLPKRYEEADQNGLQHFPQPFSENRSARD